MKDKYNKDEGFYIKAGWYAEEDKTNEKQIEEIYKLDRVNNDDLSDFIQRVVVQLEPKLTQQVLSIVSEVIAYRGAIEDGTLKNIPNGSMVITEGQHYDVYRNGFGVGYANGSKETAEKFVNLPDSDILVVDTKEYGEIEVVSVERLQELAKQFGVEIKES